MVDTPNPIIVLFGSLLMLGGVVAALRWAFGTGRSLPAPRVTDPDDPTGDGLLVAVSQVPTEAAAQVLRARLRRAGLQATLGAVDGGGYRLLVFADDEVSARIVLGRAVD